MRVLVCGSRSFNDEKLLKETLDQFDIHELIQGEAKGADTLALLYGLKRMVPVKRFPADWNKYGKRAGYIRNRQMLDEGKPDLVVAFWDGKSPGTQMMINLAQSEDIKTIVVEY